ncbi:STAS domain-containing protein [Actinoplanes sp. HUAS TT8]|uniref:STAS domain-containing protein n=1 Tax=Actinoplanes sp. HUAS TT8 TaxID=3447453 RepID=UPI003F527574
MPVVATPDFTISQHTEPGGVLRVCLAGEFDMSIGDALAGVLVAAAGRPDVTRVLVDLERTLLIDSHAVAGLVRGYEVATAAQREFVVINGRGMVQQVLDVTGLAEVLCRRA